MKTYKYLFEEHLVTLARHYNSAPDLSRMTVNHQKNALLHDNVPLFGWYKFGKSILHFVNGLTQCAPGADEPSYVSPDIVSWRLMDVLHRENGPAVVDSDGHIQWCAHGITLPFLSWLDAISLPVEEKALMKLTWG